MDRAPAMVTVRDDEAGTVQPVPSPVCVVKAKELVVQALWASSTVYPAVP
jgi:hypothetical protein